MFKIYTAVCSALLCLSGCDKYLEKPTRKNLITPSTVADLQALMDRPNSLNNTAAMSGDAASDDFFITQRGYESISSQFDQEFYTWGENPFPGSNNDWQRSYEAVFMCTVVLEGLGRVPRTPANQTEWDNVQGQALALRAAKYYELAQIWCKAYDATEATTDLGLPLRLEPDFNQPSVRVSLEETYQRILADLAKALPLVAIQTPGITRVGKAAVYGYMARTWLAMREYGQALEAAEGYLKLRTGLWDYNEINDLSATNPLRYVDNEVETPFLAVATLKQSFMSSGTAFVDTLLYASYPDNDLRKTLYFLHVEGNHYSFKGGLSGNRGSQFTAPTTSEMLLVRAECLARAGQQEGAMDDLNLLLKHRIDSDSFVPMVAETAERALQLVLQERRKELLGRSQRWADIKRLNKEGAGIVLERWVNGQQYTLQPNANAYALPLPESVIAASTMPQNPR